MRSEMKVRLLWFKRHQQDGGETSYELNIKVNKSLLLRQSEDDVGAAVTHVKHS